METMLELIKWRIENNKGGVLVCLPSEVEWLVSEVERLEEELSVYKQAFAASKSAGVNICMNTNAKNVK